MKKINDIILDYKALVTSFVMKSACKYYLEPSKLNPFAFPMCKDSKKRLLYLHIPFCFSFCAYCTFHKFHFEENKARYYFTLLRKEMEIIAEKGYNFGAMYIGGGTPTVLPDELAKTIDFAKKLFDISEVSCESDPDHINSPILENTLGRINRLSVGIQTFDDNYLKLIGRYEKFGSGEQQLEKIKKIIPHFPIVNIDMIFNYPGQSEKSLSDDINKVLSVGSSQITFYPLMFAKEEGFGIKNQEGYKILKTEKRLYQLILREMNRNDYLQRTSWAFSRDKTEIIDEYVVDNDEYVGLGSGAFSFIDDTFYINTFSLKEYEMLINDNNISVIKGISFGKHAIKQYRMMVDIFGFTFNHNFPKAEFSLLKLAGAVKKGNKTYYVTENGKYLLSLMMSEFYSGINEIRTKMRSKLNAEDENFQFYS